jgi:hypothetical protein
LNSEQLASKEEAAHRGGFLCLSRRSVERGPKAAKTARPALIAGAFDARGMTQSVAMIAVGENNRSGKAGDVSVRGWHRTGRKQWHGRNGANGGCDQQ